MMSWNAAVQLGNTSIMLPVTASITAWLLLARQWRLALWWCVLFGTGLGIVIATKMLYIGAMAVGQASDYKGASGHAMLTSAVTPVAIALLLHSCRSRVRQAGLAVSALLCCCMTACLVALKFHTLQEALHGLALGATVSIGFLWRMRRHTMPAIHTWQISAVFLVVVMVGYAKPAQLERLMNDFAPHMFRYTRLLPPATLY
ncbi:hypothetical protein GTP44_13430 [Duganella sp. FT50W]|uniref:Phosphatase PAP2 family protein n=1 Tax=Duganella lactea TaxID=2692173 RepID=A0A6L8MPT3_9BURK|nr:hypothetical protein [Duganella lactea]MYM82955.1 hypothetical protein [Duganella lactea]